ncbi:MAG TPA: type IV pilus assembly protein PilM [Candidatus Nanoarchaeia archaeon]|nr:type IV pilus assembly protein PilM [Candidatus Nanoarchaeia archaeon]
MALFSSSSAYVGVDIGASAIKMVELEKKQGKIELVSYGYSENIQEAAGDGWTKNTEYVIKVIDKIYKKMEATTNLAVATLPAFSVFSSIITLRDVDKNGLAAAVEWEAKKFIPLPLEEMILDWKVIGNVKDKEKNNTTVLLTGSPKNLVKRYVNIFRKTLVNLTNLEPETFALIRALVGSDKSTVMLAEIGAANTDIFIVKEGIPVLSRSLDIGGKTISKALAASLNISLERAEQFKRDLGIVGNQAGGDVIPKTIANAIVPMIEEVKYLLNLYQNKNADKVEKIILSGGSALLPNLTSFLSEKLNVTVIAGDPWARIFYQPELKPILTEIGPGFAVAIGAALRELS